MSDEIRLKYIGDGFLPGVPARDLTEDEVKAYGGLRELKASGLYADIEEKETTKKASASSADAQPQGDKKGSS